MSSEKEFKISIEELFPKFEEHLDTPNNKQIVFSGKFGIGKTYFLKEFFEEKKDKYAFFHLYPVNYQINSNENIIEFLKYDILVELITKNPNIFKNDNKEDIGMIEYIKKDFNTNAFLTQIISHTIDPIPQIGKIIGKSLKTMLNFDEKFQEFRKGDEGVVEKFLEKNDTETDCLSQILKNKIKEAKSNKKSVLILDDLERIDPEHIFRILNIFSAHFEREGENKFGFDKIILIVDVHNLKSIFHHKYGDNTDFNGYFDKFFSIEIFELKNEELIKKTVEEMLTRLKLEDVQNLGEAVDSGGWIKIFLEDILERAIELNGKEKLNLRQFLKGIEFTLPAFKKGNYIQNGFFEPFPQLMKISIKALVSIFSGLNSDFISVLKEIRRNLHKKNYKERHYAKFSFYLLGELIELNKKDKFFLWGRYRFFVDLKKKTIENVVPDQDKLKDVRELNNKIIIDEIFFELLIDYVKANYHNKRVEYVKQ